jgi:hypothetical protein
MRAIWMITSRRMRWVEYVAGMGQRKIHMNYWFDSGLGSIVDIVTGYGLDGLGIESWWRRDFPHLSRLALGLNQPPVQLVLGFSRG